MVTIQKHSADEVVIVVSTKASDFKVSSSGKTEVTGTGGFVALPNGLKMSVNITKPISK
jgi:hypothetical protein